MSGEVAMSLSRQLADLTTSVRQLIRENEQLRRKADESRPDNRKKLSKQEAAEIRRIHRAGGSVTELAEIFDVHHATISRIVRGVYHK